MKNKDEKKKADATAPEAVKGAVEIVAAAPPETWAAAPVPEPEPLPHAVPPAGKLVEVFLRGSGERRMVARTDFDPEKHARTPKDAREPFVIQGGALGSLEARQEARKA